MAETEPLFRLLFTASLPPGAAGRFGRDSSAVNSGQIHREGASGYPCQRSYAVAVENFARQGKFAIAISPEWVDLIVLNRGRASFLTGKGSVMSDRSKAVRASSCYFNELLESRVLLSPILFVGSQFSAGIEPRSVAVADLNADGKPDLVTTNISSNNVSVLLGERQRDVSDPADLRRRQPAAFRRGVGCQRRRQAGPRDGELQFQQRERAAQYGRRHHAPGGARRELPLRGRASSPHSVPLLSGQNSNSFNWL